jgi:hypothetical protein
MRFGFMVFQPSLLLQGTLAKRTKPGLKPNFAKEPFSPTRSEADTKQKLR